MRKNGVGFPGRPLSGAVKADPDLRLALQEQLLPRLAVAHIGAPREAEARPEERPPPSDDEVALLAELAVERDMLGALTLIDTVIRSGMSRESVLLLLIAPAARYLNDQWLSEERSFGEVMDGLKLIQEIARGV